MVQEVADIASAVLFAEAGVQLELYLASGKKKHDRYFWASIADGTIAWDKKKSANPDKVEPLESVEAEPAIMTARQWFDAIDVTQDGSLDSDEVATLYLTARGEKLGKKDLAKAMTTMNTDRNGRVTFDEFDSWWKEAGGDLEKHRDRAMTVVAGDMQLLLVAPDAQTKDRWIAGLDAILMLQGKTPTPAPAPEPEQEPERVIPAAASAEPPAAAGRRDSSDSPPAARLTPVDSSFTPATPSPIAKGAANPSAGAKPVPVKAATAWWLEQHGGTDAVPLSPGSVEQLGVWAATRQTVTQPSRPPTAPSADSADSPKKKSHDGYGALPVKTKDPITDPGFDSTGAPIPLVPPPAAPDAPGASPGPPVTADRHHAKSSTMNAVTSRWRDGDASEVPSSARSVSSAAGGSHALETHVVETPRAECFDEDSNHHPEGHWHQVKKEGEFSQHLSAHFLSRNAANGALFVDSDTTASGQVSGGGGSQGGSAVVHSVVEAERTLAGFADHGRGCHTPKFHDGSSGDHDESHGLKGHEKGHRPLPWDQHSAANPAALQPYRKEHFKHTLHRDNHESKYAPRPKVPHHQKLLRSREKRDPLEYAAAAVHGVASEDEFDNDADLSGRGDEGDVASDATLSSSVRIQDPVVAGVSLVPGRATPRSSRSRVKSSPSVRSSPGGGATPVTEAGEVKLQAAAGAARKSSGSGASAPGTGRYRGRQNNKATQNVQGKPHARAMPWEAQHAAMRTTIGQRHLNRPN